jgi:hypothetical protein
MIIDLFFGLAIFLVRFAALAFEDCAIFFLQIPS